MESCENIVSIIIPTYNRSSLIEETLDSVLSQTYPNWECIIVDDDSDDDTEQVVQRYLDKDSRFQYHMRPADRPKGANACRNYGFELSTGKFVNWLDSDDLFVKDKLEHQIKNLIGTGFQVSITQSHTFKDDHNKPYKKWKETINSEHLTRDLILAKAGWQTSAPLWNRKVIPLKPFREELPAAQEWFFHIIQSIRLPKKIFHFSDYSTVLVRRTASTRPSLVKELTYSHYLDARTLLMKELVSLDEKHIPTVIHSSAKMLRILAPSSEYQESISNFRRFLYTYSKLKWSKVTTILFLRKILGRGEKLFNYI